jgi:hypothetical protein
MLPFLFFASFCGFFISKGGGEGARFEWPYLLSRHQGGGIGFKNSPPWPRHIFPTVFPPVFHLLLMTPVIFDSSIKIEINENLETFFLPAGSGQSGIQVCKHRQNFPQPS